jgi:hypothetical protein
MIYNRTFNSLVFKKSLHLVMQLIYWGLIEGVTVKGYGVYDTFNNISVILWRSILLVEEAGENYRTAASH